MKYINNLLASDNDDINVEQIHFNMNSLKILYTEENNGKIINNDIKNKIKQKVNFDFKSISKLELLNNFYGVISSIIITKGFVRFPNTDGENTEYDIIKQDLFIEIKDYQLNFNLKFLINNEEQNCNKLKDIITYEGVIFSDDYKNICKQNNLFIFTFSYS